MGCVIESLGYFGSGDCVWGRERPNERWTDCVKNDVKEMGVNDSVTVVRGHDGTVNSNDGT